MAKKQTTLDLGEKKQTTKAVECFGLTFESEAARRAHFTEILRQKLADPAFRVTPGFPVIDDETILTLSNPPYFTLCPNPFLSTGLPHSPGERGVPQLPLAFDVNGSKRSPIYNLHSYHTKVPPEVIEEYIKHFSHPGETVLDAFCGSGMTGVAARRMGRHAALSDLSPAAALITNLTNSGPVWRDELVDVCHAVLSQVRSEWDWLYCPGKSERMSFAVWSDVWICPNCSSEIDAYSATVDMRGKRIRKEFNCQQCHAALESSSLDRKYTSVHDGFSGGARQLAVAKLVLVDLGRGGGRRKPNSDDLTLMGKVDDWMMANGVQLENFLRTPLKPGFNMSQPMKSHGVAFVRDFYSSRNLIALWATSRALERLAPTHLRATALAMLTSFADTHASRRNRYLVDKNHPNGTTCGVLSNTLFMPALQCEVNVFDKLEDKVKKLAQVDVPLRSAQVMVGTGCARSLPLDDASVDYVFIDPPFGQNIIYSDVNIVTEAFVGGLTDKRFEAIVNPTEGKYLGSYTQAMTECFTEIRRVLKPGRWLTLVFSNSRSAVWNSIQLSLARSGFVVTDVRVLNKGGGTIYQDSFAGTAKQDLVVSSYRPADHVERLVQSGSRDLVWKFVDELLRRIPPVVKSSEGDVIVAPRRFPSRIFDELVRWCVGRGILVPIDLPDFVGESMNRYAMADGMCFLPDQLHGYEGERIKSGRPIQGSLFAVDESTAIEWVRSRLGTHGASQQDLLPDFMKQQQVWARHEKRVDLRQILEENFIPVGCGGTTVWRLPEPGNVSDLARLRQRALLAEFESYVRSREKTLGQFRTEALRVGFKAAFERREYRQILNVSVKIPTSVIEEDGGLQMYVDVASMRLEHAGSDHGGT
jgi:16S rRNA G966 N2-methylase RsmD